ncbi:MAG: hypothetical protein AAGF11_34950 [Myxococcota bacterium]
MSGSLERFESILVELEPSPEQLRRDPAGRDWLPPEARALVDRCPACRAALHEFVDGELQLWNAVEPSSAPNVDPFFTARVVDALPAAPASPALSPRRRAMVLGLFHVVAGVLAYVVLTMVPESTARWAEQAHQVLRWGSDSGAGSLLAAVGVGAAVAVALLAARTHTPA